MAGLESGFSRGGLTPDNKKRGLRDRPLFLYAPWALPATSGSVRLRSGTEPPSTPTKPISRSFIADLSFEEVEGV